jgi:hypothetical protein
MALFLTPMSGQMIDHPDGETLERFVLNRCREGELDLVETHVIGCEACVRKLEQLEEEIANLKAGGELYLQHLTARKPAQQRSWFRFIAVPAFSLAGALAAGLFVTTVLPRDVALSAYRDSQITTVPEWRRLRIHLNANDLPPGPVTVQIVDDRGIEHWKGTAAVSGDQVVFEVPPIRQAGEHFVRIADSNGDLLREFAVRPKLIP